MDSLKVDSESAKRETTRSDNSRREFTKRYFQTDLEDPIHYDMVVNTGDVSDEGAASIVVHALSVKRQEP
jgi:cytidylate kinase